MGKKKNIKFLLLLSLFSLLTLSVFSGAVQAITNGQPDGDAHPYVCMVVFDALDEQGEIVRWMGSGVLISSDVVLTAGHGIYGAVGAWVCFDEDPIQSGSEFIEAKDMIMNPSFLNHLIMSGPGLPFFNYHDVGVLILSEPVLDRECAVLPEPGFVDGLSSMSPVDLVGYGAEFQVKPKNLGPINSWVGSMTRMNAVAQIVSGKGVISSEFMKLTANPGCSKGGGAFGDSGGPVLDAGSNKILGLISFGLNSNCAGISYAQRVDLPDVLVWINSFIS